MNTVTLCGSTRFLEDFNTANRELSTRGLTVFSISLALPSNEAAGGVKHILDLVHLNKILKSDAIVVVGDGYVGESTAREILWAAMQGKPIFWLCKKQDEQDWTSISYWIVETYHKPFGQSAAIQAACKVLGLEEEV